MEPRVWPISRQRPSASLAPAITIDRTFGSAAAIMSTTLLAAVAESLRHVINSLLTAWPDLARSFGST